MLSAKPHAPPSDCSSRLTLVRTACCRLMAATLSPTRRGSSGSSRPGRPVLILQKPQLQVQVSPISRKVAVPRPQHSPMLGHMASSQTVCRLLPRNSPFNSRYLGESAARTRSHSGRRPGVNWPGVPPFVCAGMGSRRIVPMGLISTVVPFPALRLCVIGLPVSARLLWPHLQWDRWKSGNVPL